MTTPESKVKDHVKKVLNYLRFTGDIIYFLRVNTGKVQTAWGSWLELAETGHFDWIVLFQNENKELSFAFIEHKRADKYVDLDVSQKLFQSKYDGKHKNIYFWLVQSGDEVREKILQHAYKRINDVEM
jgi:hypothetical protein